MIYRGPRINPVGGRIQKASCAAEMSGDVLAMLEMSLCAGAVQIMVATIAFGMGMFPAKLKVSLAFS